MGRRSTVRTVSVVFLALVLPLALFAYVAVDVERTGATGWDDDLARLAGRLIEATPIPLDGDWLLDNSLAAGVLVLAALALVLLVSTRPAYALFWTAAVGSVFVLDPFLKGIFQRPGLDGEYSFPSGSALFAAAAVSAFAWLMPNAPLRVAVVVPGAALSFLFGAAIVNVSWHYPSDVVAGWAFGLAWTTALWLAFSLTSERLDSVTGPTPAGRAFIRRRRGVR